jgi:cyclophilin family peptidyl-prolyl cis-trans isomerase
MTAEIYPGRAYNAANNFIFLARYHFYDGLPFHRVLKDTFIQTGDPVAPGITGPGYEFPDDGLPASSSQYVRGALLFAHEAADANGSQFLIISGPGGVGLNPSFPLFGQIKKGLSVLDRINAGAGTNANTPALRYSVKEITVTEHNA